MSGKTAFGSITVRGADVSAVWSTRDGLAVIALVDGREVRLDVEAAQLAANVFGAKERAAALRRHFQGDGHV